MSYLNGIITIIIAFSCTCQPNKKAVKPHNTIHLKKWIGLFNRNNFTNAGNINKAVSIIVVVGVTFGNREYENSCTKPPVIDAVTFFTKCLFNF